jgi:cytochrome P450
LRSPAFTNAGFDGAEQIMGATLPNLHGEEHGTRRRLELPLFRPEELDKHEHELLPRVLGQIRDHLVQQNGSSRDVPVDLLWWAGMVMTGVACAIVGFDGTDVPRMERVFQIQRLLGEVASPGASPQSRARTAEAKEALAELRRDFVQPSIDHRRALAAKDQLPEAQDLISILVLAGIDDDLALRELNPYLIGARTPGRNTVMTYLSLDQWFATHPEDDGRRGDAEFLARAVTESIRLWPPAITQRRALQDVTVSGVDYQRDQLVAIDQLAANVDREVFGDHAAQFDPTHDFGSKRYATAFGMGRHLCIGRELTIRDRSRTESPSFGLQVRMLEWLYRAGIRLDASNPPQRATDARYVRGCEAPIIEHEIVIRCPVTLQLGL